MLDAKDPTQPLFGYAPGTASCLCTCCRAVFEADPRAIQCHACACKLLDYRLAGIDTRLVVPTQDWWDASAPLNPALELFVFEFSQMLNGAGNSLADPPPAQHALKIGASIKFPGPGGETLRGTVCAPDDPGRTGTFTSSRYGEIPVKLDMRNRKKRRAAEAKARGR